MVYLSFPPLFLQRTSTEGKKANHSNIFHEPHFLIRATSKSSSNIINFKCPTIEDKSSCWKSGDGRKGKNKIQNFLKSFFNLWKKFICYINDVLQLSIFFSGKDEISSWLGRKNAENVARTSNCRGCPSSPYLYQNTRGSKGHTALGPEINIHLRFNTTIGKVRWIYRYTFSFHYKRCIFLSFWEDVFGIMLLWFSLNDALCSSEKKFLFKVA